ncbi:MAG TPA: Gfo/Idh/MocA family oxidoreductase [bacterium]|nr:Gfo/Idh/MocA family oxidoreductase [bacterium]
MRYLVVGYGNIGTKRKAVLGERCVGTVDPFNADADYESLSACPPETYDAAVLAVPNQAKIDLMESLLAQGKHVLVEKPLVFPDVITAERLRQAAESHKVVWYTSYNFRFEPHVTALRRLVADRAVGRIYRVRMFYGYGTAGTVAGTWRDDTRGVLQDLASHLIDLTGYVFGRFGAEFRVWERAAHELTGVDHCILATTDRQIVIECSYLSWKNRWSIEVVGEGGALHMEGLTKWGPSELVIQRRRRPSGVPEEKREVVDGPDPTWAADIAYFERMVETGQTSYDNDVWLSRTLLHAASCPLS